MLKEILEKMRFLTLPVLLSFGLASFSDAQDRADYSGWLLKNHCSASIRFTNHDFNFYSRPKLVLSEPVNNQNSKQIKFMDRIWHVKLQASVPENRRTCGLLES